MWSGNLCEICVCVRDVHLCVVVVVSNSKKPAFKISFPREAPMVDVGCPASYEAQKGPLSVVGSETLRLRHCAMLHSPTPCAPVFAPTCALAGWWMLLSRCPRYITSGRAITKLRTTACGVDEDGVPRSSKGPSSWVQVQIRDLRL